MSAKPETAYVDPPFVGTAKQRDVAEATRDPGVRVVTAGGAIRSGKTQACGRLVVEWAVERPATYLVARSTYRSLKDTTQKAMLYGDGDMPPLIPPELVQQYRASDEVVRLNNGAEILFRSLEEGQVGKLLNLTLGGIFVDQIEELDPGQDGERIFDTLLGRLSDPRGARKLIAAANPKGLTSWQYRRLVNEATRDPRARYVHFALTDNAANLPADYVAEQLETRETRLYWYRAFILGEWGAFEGAAFTEFEDAIHVVRPFKIPDHWTRFESLDHGANHPTVVLPWAADEDGNLVIFGEYSSPGLVSKHAAEIHKRREKWGTQHCWADPSVFAHHGISSPRHVRASIATEYADHGIYLAQANNDRAAGYSRLLELLHVEPGRIPPPWAQIREGIEGAPRLFIFQSCRELTQQLKSAPIAAEGADAGEAVDSKWEGEHGHAVAAARYGSMSRPGPSSEPDKPPDDPRARILWEHERKMDGPDYPAQHYEWR